MRRKARDAFYLRPGIGFGVVGGAVAVVFLAVPEIDTPRKLADDGKVDVTADAFFEWGDGYEGGGGEGAGAEVAECGEGFAEGEEALFGADGGCAPFL